MFQSFEFLECSCYDPKTNKYRWRYKIVDSEFEEFTDVAGIGGTVKKALALALEVGVGVWVGVGVGVGVGFAVIDTYSKRGLPVVPNLIIAFQWHSSEYGYSLEQLIALQKQYNPQYKQYEEEIERYLVLV